MASAMILLVSPTAFCSPTFTVPQAASSPRVRRGGPAALAKTYSKYGVHVPPSLAQAAATQLKGQTGSASADLVDYEIMYATPIEIGGQKFNMQFDTGSSAVYVDPPPNLPNNADSHEVGFTLVLPLKKCKVIVAATSTILRFHQHPALFPTYLWQSTTEVEETMSSVQFTKTRSLSAPCPFHPRRSDLLSMSAPVSTTFHQSMAFWV
jgi:hypothetical protein